jgi:hypothetical protein
MSATKAVAGQRITAAFLNANIPQDFVAITPQNSWTNTAGVASFQARLLNSVTVKVVGSLNAGTLNTQIGVLPAGMIPTNTQTFVGLIDGGTGASQDSFQINVLGGTGQIQCAGIVAGATRIAFSFTIDLDA